MIFGATGDLAQRKLLPAIYNLAHEGALPERFNLIGVVAQRACRDDEFRGDGARGDHAVLAAAPPDEKVLAALLENVRYVPGSFDDAAVYERLDEALDGVRRGRRR